MSGNKLEKVAFGAAATGAVAAMAEAARRGPVDELIAGIKDEDDKVRTDAWLGAGEVGAPAVKPLAAVMTDDEIEVARAAKRALWKIVRHCGRPGAGSENRAVAIELVALLDDDVPTSVRREVIWMLSEIGGNKCIEPIADLLLDKELREDARMALERIPGKRSLGALEGALEDVPQDFRLAVAQSLRRRGVKVPGLPCVKLVPTKQTDVKPL